MFDYVSPGDPLQILALHRNNWQDAARFVKENPGTLRGDVTPVAPHGVLSAEVRNNSGSDRSAYSILSVSGARWTDDPERLKQHIYLDGGTPAEGDESLVVTLQPSRDGQPVLAAVIGVVPVQLEVVKNSHKFAKAADGDATKLVSCATGRIRIFAKTHTTGTDWAVVVLGWETPRRLEVELTSEINADGSGTAKNTHDETDTYTIWWDRRATAGKKLIVGAIVDVDTEEGDSQNRLHIQKWRCEDEANQ